MPAIVGYGWGRSQGVSVRERDWPPGVSGPDGRSLRCVRIMLRMPLNSSSS